MTSRRELSYNLLGLNIATLQWGPTSGVPVLALHGWLDNAASFDRLAPLLAQCHVVAPDLAGHGHSDHMPLSGSYNLWDDLRYLVALLDTLGWQRFALIGHSRGGMIAVLLASALGDRVTSLICIDALIPEPVEAKAAPEQLAKHLNDAARPVRPPRKFDSVAQALAMRSRGGHLSGDDILPVVERNLRPFEDGLAWRWDRRLLGASALKLSVALADAYVSGVSAPIMLCVAERGMGQWPGWRERLAAWPQIECLWIPGGHHCHLEREGLSALLSPLELFLLSNASSYGAPYKVSDNLA